MTMIRECVNDGNETARTFVIIQNTARYSDYIENQFEGDFKNKLITIIF